MWPGGFEPPGVWVIAGGVAVAVAGVFFWLEVWVWRWVAVGVAAFILAQTPIAWLDCRRGGSTCPDCGGVNTVRPWSL